MIFPTYKNEMQKFAEGFLHVAGCDEVGVAPLAGPVVAATVLLDPNSIGKQRSKNKWWYRVRDSKTTTEKERAELVKFIYDHCMDYGLGTVSHETIDEINILQAGILAMKKSVQAMRTRPDFIFLDGIRKIKTLDCAQETIISGDVKVLSIAAASIVAKVARDEICKTMHRQFPEYGFDQHKGYPTKMHREALVKFGVTPLHRQSFGFVKLCLQNLSSVKYFRKSFII